MFIKKLNLMKNLTKFLHALVMQPTPLQEQILLKSNPNPKYLDLLCVSSLIKVDAICFVENMFIYI